MDRNVRLLDGTLARIVCDDEDRVEAINSIMIEPFMDEIEEGWLAKGERSMPAENRIKGYLSYVGYLMFEKPDSFGILSMNKIRNIQKHEYSNEDLDKPCPLEAIAEKINARKQKRTWFVKYEEIEWGELSENVRVDTEGCFEFDGMRFKVVDMRYAGTKAAGWDCPYYQFDRIWVWVDTDKSSMRFYDQNLDPIPDEHIFAEITKKDGGEMVWRNVKSETEENMHLTPSGIIFSTD